MKRVLITGATGFVGRTLCEALLKSGYTVRSALRTAARGTTGAVEAVIVGDIGPHTDWTNALRDVDSIIHLAARAHVVRDDPTNATVYFSTNEGGTASLAAAAVQAGVRRMVYLSSIKVNGEETSGRAFSGADEPQPRDAYGMSKWQGERRLWEFAAGSRLEATVVRSPLVYGPGVRANFLRLLSWVDRRMPLPLAAVANRRSLVNVWNLCDLLIHATENPAAAGGTWMVTDGEDLSTPELIRRIGRAMRRPVRLFSVPVSVLRACGALIGRNAEVMRLCGSLAIDAAPTRARLEWSAPVSVDEALERTVAWYLSEKRVRGA